jgi:hypothetical protein
MRWPIVFYQRNQDPDFMAENETQAFISIICDFYRRFLSIPF